MAREVASNAWAQFIHHDTEQLLELRWLESTATMSDDDFKASLAVLAREAERLRTPYLLVDATRFRHKPGPGVMEWRDAHIIPQYNRAGVVRFAFLIPAGAPGTMEGGGKPVVEKGAAFATAWFGDRQNAMAWLRSAQ